MLHEVIANLRGLLPSYFDYGAKPLIYLAAAVAILFLWRAVRP